MKRKLPHNLLLPVLLLTGIRFTEITINGNRFTAEIADTPEKQMLGLMFRTSIQKDFAMLFIFPDEQIRSFWMKNTRISLDIIYLNKQRQIVGMENNVPPCRQDPCPSYTSPVAAQYVVEITGNLARELKLKIGDQFTFFY